MLRQDADRRHLHVGIATPADYQWVGLTAIRQFQQPLAQRVPQSHL